MEKRRYLKIKEELNLLKQQSKPTDIWEDNLKNDELYEELYTIEGIEDVSKVLDLFIDTLIGMNDYSNIKMITEEVKKLILKLNSLNEKHNYMIETDEREDLCEFIDTILTVIGFENEYDITEEWREW